MKSVKLIQLSFMAVALLGFSLTGCKKDNLNKGSSDNTSIIQLAADELTVNSAIDDAAKDAETVLSMSSNRLKSSEGMPCHASIDSVKTKLDTVTYFITYNGDNCIGKRTRTGKIEIKKAVGTHWVQAGATVSYKYIDYTITNKKSGKSIVLNGKKTFKNVSGGTIWQLGQPGIALTSIIHTIKGTMYTKFEDGTTRMWNISRQIAYTGTPGQLIMTVDGMGTVGDYTKLVTWGTNRNNEEFFTQITQSVVHKELCEWDPISGIKVHRVPAKSKSATITFGFDKDNLPITAGNCPEKYRVDWQIGGNSGISYLLLH